MSARITDLQTSIALITTVLRRPKFRNDRVLRAQLAYMKSELSLILTYRTRKAA